MCKLESCSEVPMASQDALDVVDGVEDVLEEVLDEQVKQQLWECAVNILRRFVQWCVERVRR